MNESFKVSSPLFASLFSPFGLCFDCNPPGLTTMTTPAPTPTPIRKKRNFKALQLDVSQSAKPKEPEPIPTRAAPATTGVAKGKKRPPPMTLNAPKLGQTPVTNDADGNLAVAPPSAPATASARRNYHTTLSTTLAKLDMNAETRFDLRNEDLKDLQELGQGNGGSVKKVEHVPTKTIMAKKVSHQPTFSHSADILLLGMHRSFLLMPNQLCASKFCVNYTSCMIATLRISFLSTARSCRTQTFVFAWSTWTRGLLMVSIRRSEP